MQLQKINPFNLPAEGFQREIVPDEGTLDYWVGIEDDHLVVSTEPEASGNVLQFNRSTVRLSDQMLVWLAIEGLCQLRASTNRIDLSSSDKDSTTTTTTASELIEALENGAALGRIDSNSTGWIYIWLDNDGLHGYTITVSTCNTPHKCLVNVLQEPGLWCVGDVADKRFLERTEAIKETTANTLDRCRYGNSFMPQSETDA